MVHLVDNIVGAVVDVVMAAEIFVVVIPSDMDYCYNVELDIGYAQKLAGVFEKVKGVDRVMANNGTSFDS